jgi:ABC-type transport system involved in cytochrome c biogenesis permease subunit
MNAKQIALAMILLSFMFLGMAFLTGCAGFKNPSVCLKTSYGTFCYELPEIEGLKK